MTRKNLPLSDPPSTLDKYKSWFRYSEVLFITRMGALVGAGTSFVGQMDLSPLWSLFSTGTDFNSKQVFWIGVSIVGAALTVDFARRRNMGE